MTLAGSVVQIHGLLQPQTQRPVQRNHAVSLYHRKDQVTLRLLQIKRQQQHIVWNV